MAVRTQVDCWRPPDTSRLCPLPSSCGPGVWLAAGSVDALAHCTLFILLFIYYTVYAHVKSFTIVKHRKCGQVTSHCRKARPYRADLSLFLNVPVVTVKSEKKTDWGRLFQTVGEAWQKAHWERLWSDMTPDGSTFKSLTTVLHYS